MKFNMRSLMKHNMRKHHESEGEGWHTAFGADPVGVDVNSSFNIWTNWWTLTKVANTHIRDKVNKWLYSGDLNLIFKVTVAHWTLPGSPGMYRRWGHRHMSPVPIYPLGLDKTNFPRIQENIFIRTRGCVARCASHYFSKGAICVPLDDQERNICTLSSHRATRELYAKVPSHRAPVRVYAKAVCA